MWEGGRESVDKCRGRGLVLGLEHSSVKQLRKEP